MNWILREQNATYLTDAKVEPVLDSLIRQGGGTADTEHGCTLRVHADDPKHGYIRRKDTDRVVGIVEVRR
jgi:hypothetical protein